jgi:hypothetical protein
MTLVNRTKVCDIYRVGSASSHASSFVFQQKSKKQKTTKKKKKAKSKKETLVPPSHEIWAKKSPRPMVSSATLA